ncbi:putative TRAP transporter small permease protein [Moorella sp. E308F]|uniref:TRAP transporter small permease n=1 Tax=Moorella sp. E308F TaxID=2572682 RepID=UPI0010FFB91D|nr:TRAP transporter small permease [Moorella sp. E308F]GEA15707.1 putative TRAP transporter small permease protein [Moorella sp. E308F]
MYKNLTIICEKILQYTIIILLSGMVIVVFFNVIGRYFLNAAIAWSEEVSRFMLIWLVFLGAILAYINDEHLGLDIVVKSIPKKAAKVIAVIADLLVLYAITIILKGGYSITMESWDWTSPAAAIPYAYVYLIVPISGAILFLQTILKIIYHIKALFMREASDKVQGKEGVSC